MPIATEGTRYEETSEKARFDGAGRSCRNHPSVRTTKPARGACAHWTLVVVLTGAAVLHPGLNFAGEPSSTPEASLPAPYETFPHRTAPSVLHLGPGNTFSVGKTSPDFELYSIAMSRDGKLLALGWGSGRIGLWDLQTKKPVSEFKSKVGEPLVLLFNGPGTQLIVAGPGGKTGFFEIPHGKALRRWKIPRGKRKYDTQALVIDPAGKWLAYANEDNSKVLALTAKTPAPLADLENAGAIALSQDGTELWTANRVVLRAYNTSTWKPTGEWKLEPPPIDTSSVIVKTGMTLDGVGTVAVPSSKGLLIFRGPQMHGELVTNKPTSGVEYARAEHVYVDLTSNLVFLDPTGHARCTLAYEGRSGSAMSDDGQWLALSHSSKVDLWRMEDLLRDCPASP